VGFGTNFNKWLKEQGKEQITPEIENVLNEVGKEIAGDEEWKARTVSRICDFMGTVLQQEYKLYGGQWWLWSLGKPVRQLTASEIEYHKLGSACSCCEQVDEGQTGEHPCPECGLPIIWDEPDRGGYGTN
jgi:predicted RNA-binding Zn-ribbon protein involved in translation (DUF1610 family)